MGPMLGGGVLSRRASVPYANASMPARAAAGMVSAATAVAGPLRAMAGTRPYTATNVATSASHAAAMNCGRPQPRGGVVERPVQTGYDFGGIEQRAPADRRGEAGGEEPEVAAGVGAHGDPALLDAQRPHAHVQERDQREDEGDCERRVPLLQRLPRQLAGVVAEIALQYRIEDAEARRARRQNRREPVVAGAPRDADAVREPRQDGPEQQQTLRHGLHDLEIAQAPRHLHRADGAIHPPQMRRAPPDRQHEQRDAQQLRQVAGRDVEIAAADRVRPGALRGLEREPTPAHEQRDERHTDDEQPGAARLHAAAPAVASQPSTSARYAASASARVASKRITSTGPVFDARSRPHPSGNVMRTPSSVATG